MAPLKPVLQAAVGRPASYFHDYFVMAPLKLDICALVDPIAPKLPWLFCHGPIEAGPLCTLLVALFETSMTILSWPHWSGVISVVGRSASVTSMTILSWPHWSRRCCLLLLLWLFRLPWLFCHGPIEAHIPITWVNPQAKTSMTILSWPHWSVKTCWLEPWLSRTSMTILSWPHWSYTQVYTKEETEPTSMTILSWPHWSN